jgi:mono/diheme cytochrome c family protein
MKTFTTIALTLLATGGSIAAWLATGRLDIAADSPHSRLVFKTLEFARERSIDEAADDIDVPALGDPRQIAEGGEHYAAMCDGCHLGPGVGDNEFRKGLYPQPPDFSKQAIDSPGEAYWVIKHGLKMTAMPAWGMTHDDKTIWAIVAFLQKLPNLTPSEYKQIAANAAAHHDDAHHDDAHDDAQHDDHAK